MRYRRFLATLLAGVLIAFVGCGENGSGSSGAGCTIKPGELVITEVFSNPAGKDDEREWFEIFNATDMQLSLTGLTIKAGSLNSLKSVRVPAALDPGIPPRGFLTVGNGALGNPDNTAGYSWPSLSLANTSGVIVLACISGTNVVEIDRVEYGEGAKGPEAPGDGVSIQLSGDLLKPGVAVEPEWNDNPLNWCPAEAPYGSQGDKGTPGKANRTCPPLPPPKGKCYEGDKLMDVVVSPGALMVTEVFANPTGSDDKNKEWIEVRALADVYLNGLIVEHATETSSVTFEVTERACRKVTNGDIVVLAGSADPASNGNLPTDGILYGFADGLKLYNGEATVRLKDFAGNVVSEAKPPAASSKGGISVSLDRDFQTDPTKALDTAYWCDARSTGLFDGTGTPGRSNDKCL